VSKVVGDIAINVSADVGPLVREMDRGKDAVNRFEGAGKRMKAGFQSVASGAMVLAGRLTIVTAAMGAAVAGAVALAKGAAETGDRIAKSARQAGVSAQYYQEMEYAIRQVTNLTQEEFDKALVTLNRRLGEAQQGSEGAIDAFEKLGFSQADLASGAVTTEQAMDAATRVLSGITDPSLRAAVATELFGRAGAKLGGQLGGAAGEISSLREEATKLGIVLTGEQLDASEKFGDSWDSLTRSFAALKVQIGANLLPYLVNTLIPTLRDQVIPAIGAVATKIGELITWFQNLPKPVQDAAGYLQAAFNPGSGAMLAIGALAAAAPVLAAAWEEWGGRFKTAVGGAIDWVTEKLNAFLALLDRIKTGLSEILSSTPEQTQRARDALSSSGAGLGPSVSQNGINAPGSGEPAPGGAGGGGGGGLGAQTANGLVNGFIATMAARQPEIDAAINAVPLRARELLGIQSPSVVFAEIGAFVGEGFANGIASAQGLVASAVGQIGATAVDGAKSTTQQVLASMSQLFTKSKPLAAAVALINAYQGATEALKLPFPKNLAAFASVLATGLGAVRSIQSTTSSGSSGGSRGGGGSAAATSALAAPAPTQTLNFNITNDPFGIGERTARQMSAALNEANRNGVAIRSTVSVT
jgi:hypothetical protein